MDRKSVFVLALAFGLLMLWYPLVNQWFPPTPLTPEQLAARGTNAPAPAISPASTNTTPPELVATAPAPLEAPAAILPPAGPEETVVLESADALYTFTSRGGGLKEIRLKHYPEAVGRQARKSLDPKALARLNADAPLPIMALGGPAALLGDGEYQLTQLGGGLRAEKQLESGLRIIKEYRPETNYLVKVAVRIENVSTQALQLPAHQWVLGTATPISPHDDGQLIRMQWFDGRKAHEVSQPYFANRTLGCFPGTPRSTYVAGESNVVWSAAQNQFFAIITMAPTNEVGDQVVAQLIDMPRPTMAELRTDRQMVEKPFGIQTALLQPDQVLAPGAAVVRHFDVFAGPKEYRLLDRMAGSFDNQVDLVMSFGGFFGFFAKMLLLSMNGLHAVGLSYGLAIILITVIIKLLFWPLTQASTRSMKRMQLLQPQMKEIQAKFKDDPKKMNERMMAFMKEHRINPAAGCLPILIQIPVFFGFFKMLRSAIELRGASFLWAFDLSQPDTVWMLPGLGFPVNPLPIIMGVTQLWQMRLTPPSPGMDPVQQKIFQFMPLMFLFILYNFSSGLTLYWTVQNLLTIAQMKLTKSTGEPPPAPKGAPGRKPRRPNRP